MKGLYAAQRKAAASFCSLLMQVEEATDVLMQSEHGLKAKPETDLSVISSGRVGGQHPAIFTTTSHGALLSYRFLTP